ncbi:MAG: rod shape-determining protein MreD [Lysobacteraceae bacterium]
MSRSRARPGLFFVSLLIALLLGLLPLPAGLAVFKPYWVALVLIYWLLEAPDRVGLGMAFVIGLVADLVYGTLFGEQAMRLIIIAFLVLRFRARLRFFPLSQQALAVLGLLLNDRVVSIGIRAFGGEGLPPASIWLAPLVGMLLWPWLFLLLDRVSTGLRK